MSINAKLMERCQGMCELCTKLPATNEYTVSPRSDESIEYRVALCDMCMDQLDANEDGNYWRCLEGSIWNPEPSVQALSYRLLQKFKSQDWANDTINSVELDDNTIQWAMSAYEIASVHKDAYGNLLENGDNVVLIQVLNVKGANFMAAKGTIVKKIKLVEQNTDQIEGKINDQTIVILTKFVKKA
jgi:protein PhnA